jgi:pimeloyl-ACP methyl ester carboxylesterase
MGMPNSFIQGLLKPADRTMLQGIHWIAHGVLRTGGYRWEVRRNGEVKIGYWKKTLRARDHKAPYPKRFVLMPGFGDTPLSWLGVMTLLHSTLKSNYDELILFDFPGFGGFLSRERAFPSVDLMMTAVADTLDSLKPHTIFGHSLGGWLAASYAALCGSGQRPVSNRLNYSGPNSLIVANPSGIYPDQKTMDEFETLIRSSVAQGFELLRPHLFAKEPSWFICAVPHMRKFLGREDIMQFVDSGRTEHALTALAQNIQARTWVLWGEKDTLVPSTCADAWLASLNAKGLRKDHTAIIIKKAGHSPHIETPVSTAIIMSQILKDKTPYDLGKRWWTVTGK